MKTIQYSVIIPTHNGSLTIGSAIESLLRQTISPENFEIIIVDDASTDATAHVVERYKAAYPSYHIRCLRFEVNRGPAAARNAGMRCALGSIFFFTDDDCEVPALWIENHAAVYARNPEVAGVGGWYTPLARELRESRYQLFIHVWYKFLFRDAYGSLEGKNIIFRGRSRFPAVNSGNLSVKKYVVGIVGGFDERFRAPGSEDVEFSNRVIQNELEMYYLPLMVTHHKDMGLSGLIRMARNRIKGRLVHEHVVWLQWRNAPSDPPFLRFWRNFRDYYTIESGDKKRSLLPPSVLAISALYLFLVYSKIARWYWRRKLNLS